MRRRMKKIARYGIDRKRSTKRVARSSEPGLVSLDFTMLPVNAIILLPLVSARYMLTSQWTDSDTSLPCSTVPDVMYGWILNDESAKSPSKNQTWPLMYKYMASLGKQYSARCWGTLKVPLSKECCGVVTNPELANNYSEGATVLADPQNPLEAATKRVNNSKYCALQTTSNSSLFGIDKAYYSPSGKCIYPENIKCLPDFTLEVYTGPSCSGTPQRYPLTETKTTLVTSFGQVIGQVVTQLEGKTEYSWNALLPSIAYIPDFKFWSDYLLVGCYSLSIVFTFIGMVYFVHRFITRKKAFPLYCALNLTLWMTFCTLRLICQFQGNYTKVWDGLIYFFQMTGSLSSVLLSMTLTFTLLDSKRMVRRVLYTIVVLMHFGLNWNNYTRYSFGFNLSPIFTPTLVSVMFQLNYAWIIFMYFVDFCPAGAIFYRIVIASYSSTETKKQKFVGGVADLWNNNPVVIVLMFGNLLNWFFYILVSQMRTNSEVLGDDRVWIAFSAVDSFSQAIHCIFNVVLLNAMSAFALHHSTTNSYSSSSKLKRSH